MYVVSDSGFFHPAAQFPTCLSVLYVSRTCIFIIPVQLNVRTWYHTDTIPQLMSCGMVSNETTVRDWWSEHLSCLKL